MKASNAASASLLVSAIQISCNDRLAFGCWLFGSLLRTLAVLCTQQRCSRVVGHSSPSRSEEHTSELQSHVISYAVFCLKKNTYQHKSSCIQLLRSQPR